ncbi:class I SAM-dependent methyltransferase [Teredinibacter turnerae]|uniref:class I SAM-dependent methyltransferase n=1 Tax=Teredinibacter turnerae TaxID=2426 RepID=UPI0005F84E3C|nr:class I SAM-dependent methyltransferase [Teredinibacter turnerae]
MSRPLNVSTFAKSVARSTVMAQPGISIGEFKEHLRNQISTSTPQSVAQLGDSVLKDLNQLVHLILQQDFSLAVEEKLAAIFPSLYKLYAAADIPRNMRTRRFINKGGLVISPDHCVNTIKDAKRVYCFIKGVHQQISHMASDGHPVRIAYPACGPFAPFVLPLLAYYSAIPNAPSCTFTFIDIQPGAIHALKFLLTTLGMSRLVEDTVCMDALEYTPTQPFDIVVLEAMQHGFSREAHLQLAMRFARYLTPDGVLLPKKIVVGASLVNAQTEFIDQWHSETGNRFLRTQPKTAQAQRLFLGQLLTLDIEQIRRWNNAADPATDEPIPCGTVTLPTLPASPRPYTLIIHSTVSVCDGLDIAEYESGITHPLPDPQVCINYQPNSPEPGDLIVNSGDILQFYYCHVGIPGFLPVKVTVTEHEPGSENGVAS